MIIAGIALWWWVTQQGPRVGACYDYPADEIQYAFGAAKVDCGDPHTAETFAVVQAAAADVARDVCAQQAQQWLGTTQRQSRAHPAVWYVTVLEDGTRPRTARCDAVRWRRAPGRSNELQQVTGTLAGYLRREPAIWVDCRKQAQRQQPGSSATCRQGKAGFVVFESRISTPGAPSGDTIAARAIAACRRAPGTELPSGQRLVYEAPTERQWRSRDSWSGLCYFEADRWRYLAKS